MGVIDGLIMGGISIGIGIYRENKLLKRTTLSIDSTSGVPSFAVTKKGKNSYHDLYAYVKERGGRLYKLK